MLLSIWRRWLKRSWNLLLRYKQSNLRPLTQGRIRPVLEELEIRLNPAPYLAFTSYPTPLNNGAISTIASNSTPCTLGITLEGTSDPSNDQVHLAISGGPTGGGFLTAPADQTLASNQASWTGLEITAATAPDNFYTVTATDVTNPSIPAATMEWEVSPAAANQLAVTQLLGLNTLASFNGSNGYTPYTGLIEDSSGNFYGTTTGGGSHDQGTVFEIAKGSNTITTLATFDDYPHGASPQGGLVIDSNGNLYGTAATGGPDGSGAYGTVFEVVKGSGAITTLAAFDDANGYDPQGGLVMDSSGNLYGTAAFDGPGGNGTVFEVVNGSNTITTLASFDGDNGRSPEGNLVMDSSGNLFGTTAFGGPNSSDGTVFELPNGSSTITTLASFDNFANGSDPNGGVIEDSNGNLYGTTNEGGPGGYGTVFELANGSSTITTLASFNYTNGSNPNAPVILDSNGNLWGTTTNGGPDQHGTVFEVANGSSVVTTVVAFNYTNGGGPRGDLLLDSSGNFYGTTAGGGTYGDGTVFELQVPVNGQVTPAGQVLAPLDVAVEDTYGNVVTTSNAPITMSVTSGPGSFASGTTTVNAVNGVATFSDLILDTAGSYVLTASDTPDGLISGSTNVTITTDAASQLVITQSPTTSTAGQVLTPALQVSVEDQYGNLVTTSTAGITVSAYGPGGFTSGTLTETAVNGVATFPDLVLDTAGTYTLAASDTADGLYSAGTDITVNPAAASQLVITQTPGTTNVGQVLSPALQVSVEDQYGNVVTASTASITVSVASGPESGFDSGTLTESAINGIATFSDLVLDTPGAYTLTASDTADGLPAATTSPIAVLPILIVTQTPGTTLAGQVLSPSLVVDVEDGYGQVVTTSTAPIEVSANGPGSFASGTLTEDAVNGVATFSDLILDTAGTYTLTASDFVDGLIPAISSSFTVTPNVASQLVITQTPGISSVGQGLSPALQVSVEDEYGNVVTTSTAEVTVVVTGPGGFASGTTMVNAVNGVATFADLVLDTPGTYTLTASDTQDGLTSATTSSFTVNPLMVFTQIPSTKIAGQALNPVQVSLEDVHGNVDTASTLPVTISVASGPGSFASGTTTVYAVNGVATFSDLVLDTAGNYTLTASDPTDSLIPVSTSFTLSAGAASQLAFTQTPQSNLTLGSFTYANGAYPQSGVVEDSNGNLFGTTQNGGAYGAGTVYEIARGSQTITVLASFNYNTGDYPKAGLVIDSNGNLYGSAPSGGVYGYGTVFEVAAGSGTITPLASFDGYGYYSNGANPYSSIVLDSSGNLFGTTTNGGADGDGTVFELAAGSNTITTLATFNYTNGVYPNAVIVDSSGNLYGTAGFGGAYGDGTVFEVANGSGTITTLASFNYSNGDYPEAGLAMDSNGNLYGTTTYGGTYGEGTVFEVTSGTNTITTLAAFNNSNGANPYQSGVVLDSSGNLFGTTVYGGANGQGTVYELAKGSSTITTLVSFNGTNGANPYAGVVFDSSGNLLGTTQYGGASGNGTVFDLATSPGQIPTAGVALTPVQVSVEDAYGNLVTTSNAPVTVSVSSGPGDFTSDSTTTVDAVNGVATFSNLVLDTSGNYTLTASDTTDGLNTANTDVTVVPAAASQLVITQTPGATNVGQLLSPALEVEVEDQFGNLVTNSTANLTVSVASGPETGFDSGTLTESPVNGVATFSDLVLDIPGVYTLGVSDTADGLIGATSSSFTVNPVLEFTQFPGTTAAGQFLSPSLQVSVVDGYGNAVTSSTAPITVYAVFGPGPFSSGTLTENAVDGVATFSDLTLDTAGSYQIAASDPTDGLTTIYSNSITITPAAPSQLAITQTPGRALSTLAAFGGNNGQSPYAGVVMDSSGDLFGTTVDGGANSDGTVYEIASGTTTITTLATFNYTNGSNPYGGVVLDSNGNLFGTTQNGGAYGDGTVYEIAKGSHTITTLASFNYTNGANPKAGVVLDSSGDLFGTAPQGGDDGYGTIFEVIAGSGTITTLASFDGYGYGSNGANPYSGVILDSSGDLFGTTTNGGANSVGTVFELTNGSNTITTLASFNYDNGAYPNAVTLDSSGNLYGTAGYGGTNGDGSVFEVTNGSGAISMLASFDYTNGYYPNSGVVLDSNGDLFGTTVDGGANYEGTVYEIASGTGTITTLASFNSSNGANPQGGLVLDSNGNLFGTSSNGGANYGGTVFEIPSGSGTITTLGSFNETFGSSPGSSGVVMDSSGDLFGTTNSGGANNDGTIYEVPQGTSTIITLASFDYFNSGYDSAGSLVLDSNGNLYGTTTYGGAYGDGTVFELAKDSDTISVLAAFDSFNSYPSGLTIDSSGDLFGTTTYDGAYGAGTVFELANGSGAITTLATFNYGNGAYPQGGLTLDSSGNLYGTTTAGGANGDGTVYELASGTGTISTLASFDGTNGYYPQGNLALDSNGNLFGATQAGGTSGAGTVYELVNGSGTITPLASFNYGNGANPLGGVTLDSSGNLYGTTSGGGADGEGTVYELAHGTSTISTLGTFDYYDNGASPQSSVILDSNGNLYGTTAYGGPNYSGTIFELGGAIAGQVLSPSLQVSVEDQYGNLVTDSNAAITVSATMTAPIADPGFETPALGDGGFSYSPISGSPWTFGSSYPVEPDPYGSGIASNDSGISDGNPGAPQGAQVAFIQGSGSISQAVDLGAGSYVVSFSAAQRGNYFIASQVIEVLVDGTAVGTVTPSGFDYATYSTPAFTVSAGEHTLEFLGLNPNGVDCTAFIDQVSVTSSPPFASGTTTVNAVNGVATFSDLVLDEAGTYTLTATDTPDGLTPATTSSFTVSAAAASQLVVTQTPGTSTAGQTLSSPLQVSVEDQYGNLVTTSNAAVTVSVANGPGDFASGTLTEDAVDGVATFSDLVLDTAGSYTLNVTDTPDNLTPATSTSFTVGSGAASQLMIAQNPDTSTAGQALSPSLQVSVEDQYGNLVTSSMAAVTVSVASGPGDFASGTLTEDAINGVATFSDLVLDTAGTYTLNATDTPDGLTSATTNGFTVSATAASQLAITQASDTTPAGQVLNPALQVSVEDPYGNLVTDSNAAITVSATQYAAIADPGFETPALGDGGFSYSPISGSPWTFGSSYPVEPDPYGSGIAGNDSGISNGNPAAPQGMQVAFIQGTGSISQAVDFGAGSYVVSFSAAQRGNYFIGSQVIEVLIDGTAVGTVTPSGFDYATYSTPAFTVSAGEHTLEFLGLNPSGVDCTAFIDQVSATTTAAFSSGTTTVNAVNGVATFSDLVLDEAGTYTLTATDTPDGLTSATTSSFTVNAVIASQLAITQTPGTTNAGQVLSPSLQVSVEDADGNVVTDSNAAITVSATLTAPIADPGFETPSVGYGSFAYRPISGSPWTFQNDAGITGNNSGFTSVNPPAPEGAQAAFIQDSGSISQSLDFATGSYVLTLSAAQRGNYGTSNQTIEVLVDGTNVGTITPSGTNYATYSTPAFNVSAGTHTLEILGLSPSIDDTAFIDQVSVIGTIAFASGTTTENAVNGVATFSDLILDPAGTYTLTASDTADGLTPATSSSFTVIPVAASQLAFTQGPSTTNAGQEVTPALQVSVEDPYGNVVPTSTATITLSVTGPGDFASETTETAVNGVATFSDLVLDTPGTYTLTATDSADGLPSVTTTLVVNPVLVVTQSPGTTTAGQVLSPALQVNVEDGYGNVLTDSNAAITVSATQSVAIADPGFENPSVGYGSFAYDPNGGSPWTFQNDAGITGNNSGFTSGNPPAPQGAQAAFIQDYGSVSQSLDFATGSYVLSFSAAQRQNYGTSDQTIEVLVDGTDVGTIHPSGTDYATYSTPAFNVSAGTHTIELLGLSPNNGDTAFVDQVSVIGTVAFASGTTTENAVNGMATFSDLVLDTPGTYTLTASDTVDGLTSVTTSSFVVNPVLVVTQSPGATTAGQVLNPALQLSVEDGYGNLVINSTAAITVSATQTAPNADETVAFASGTTTENPVNGVATFSDLVLDPAGTYILTASDTADGLTPATSGSFTVSQGAASQLVITQTPGTTTVGQELSPSLQVSVEDGFGNLVSDSNAAITVSATLTAPIVDPGFETPSVGYGSFVYGPISGSPWTFTPTDPFGAAPNGAGITGNNSGFTSGTPSAPEGSQVAFIEGNGSFSQSVNLGTGSYVVTFSAAQRENYGYREQTFEVLVDGTAVGTITPSGGNYSTYSTSAFNVSAGNHIIEFLGLNPTGYDTTAFIDQVSVTGTVAFASGTTTENAVNGVATFSGLVLNTAGTYTLTATDWVDGLNAATSSGFTVSPAAVSQLVITQTPGTTNVGQDLTPALQVSLEDTYGNVVTTSTANITVSVNGPADFASGTTTVAAVNGVATFSDLILDTPGTYTLTASDTADGLNSVTTSSFVVNPVLVVTQSPGTTTTAGQVLSPALQVSVEDGYGNVVTDSNAAITVSASQSVAISDPGFETPSVGYGSFAYGPISGSPWTFQNGAGISGNNSGFTSGNPYAPEGAQVAFIQNYGSISQSLNFSTGSYVLTVSAAQRGNYGYSDQEIEVLVDGTAVGTIIPSGPDYSVYNTPAFNVSAGNHTIELLGLDPLAIDNTAFIDQVSARATVAFDSGTATENAVNGVATFSDLVLNTAGIYTLTIKDTADGYQPVRPANITVNPAAASQLVITQTPGTATAGQTLTPLQVSVEDQYGNVETDNSVPVTVSVASGPSDFASGTTTVDAVNGLATFSDLVLDTAGTYTLSLTDTTDGLPSVTTSSFTVSPAAASQLVITQTPGSTTAGQELSPSLQVSVEDQYGNVETASTASVTVSTNGPGGFTSGSTTTVNAVNGVATFSNLTLDTAGSYTLLVTDTTDGLFSTTSTITVNSAAASQLVITQSPAYTLSDLASFGSSIGSYPYTSVVLDSNGDIFSTTLFGGPQNDGTVYEIASGSNTITTLATFNGNNGYEPLGKLAIDSSGNLYGTTSGGGPDGYGTIYELAAGSGTITTLAAFNGTNGFYPATGLVMDSSGNLFGATNGSTSNSYGTIFELAAGSGTITTLATFNYGNGAYPNEVIVDGGDNVYGTTSQGGAYGVGTVFELTNGSGTITTLASFDGNNGEYPYSGVALDSSGNLYGTTAENNGTVFEVAAGSGTITTLATFNGGSGVYPGDNVVLDSSGNLYGTTSGGGEYGYGTVFELPTGSGTLTALASFNGTDGYDAETGVTLDSTGNLFGTTIHSEYGGTVFEVVNGSGTVTTLASFNQSIGTDPYGNVSVDQNGNVFGTTAQGGLYADGTIYELAAGSGTITTLAAFNGTNGSYAYGGVVEDGSGNLFGTTSQGGADGYGTIFELAAGSDTITTLASFDYSNTGGYPSSSLVLDSNGDLFGSTSQGGAYGEGTVFELPSGSGTITAIGTFDGSNGSYPTGPVTLDSNGNVYGTTDNGGVNNNGTVYEVANGSGTITTLASFTAGNPSYPDTGVVIDSSGNLFGTTYEGGADSQGTVYELAAGSGVITTLASFNGNNGSYPDTGVVLDSNGNLFGTTFEGGASNEGTVYELAAGSGTVTTLASFNSTSGFYSSSGLALDSSGNLFGTTVQGGFYGEGTVYELQPQKIAGQVLSPSLQVSVEDAYGNVVTNSTASVTVSANGPGSFASGSTTTVDAVNGVATFSNLTLDTAGTYTLTVSDTTDGLTPATSGSFAVNPAAASQLVITQTPGTSTAGQALSPSLQVSVEDQYGNVETNSTAAVTVAVASGPETGFDSGTLTVDAVNGVATFTDLVLDTPGTYTLTASDTADGLPSVTTSSFTVNPVLVITQTPGTTIAGQVLSPSLQVSVEDGYGNVETGRTAGITVSANGPGSFASGTQTVNAVNGVATFSDLVLDTAGTYTLTASDNLDGLASVTSSSFTVSPATASQLAFTEGPGINTLASFNGTDGAFPYGGVVLDSNGDLFGTTQTGGVNSDGNVYEIAKGSNTITTLASFNYTNGAYPVGGVVLDSNGNLYGTTTQGGANGNGTVFEIANGSDTITTLASFDYYTNGSDPTGSIVLDSNGDLFGTTNQGGTNGYGTVYEIAYGSGTITTLASFDYYNTGAYPNAGVTMDSNGNLFGTTTQGPAYGEGTVYEVVNGSNTITTVAFFNDATGSPSGGVVLDSNGNLYSTTAQGGNYGDGSVVEVVSGSGSMTILASFNGNDGQNPQDGVTLDSSGNLYGTTEYGGANGDGTVYEIINGSGTITTLSSFNDSNGARSQDGVTLDSNGNLFGTTSEGGADYTGTVFELPVSPAAGQVLSPSPQVSVQDVYGNVVTSSTDAVTVSVASGPGSFASGTLTVNAVNGVATFSDLVLDTAGSYTLTAMDTTDGLNPATSSSFLVNPAEASQLVISQTPGTSTITQALNPSLQVSVEDPYGNLVTTSSASITVSANGPGGFTPGSTTTVNAANGVATFSNLILDTPGTYTLTVSDTADGLTSATTSSFTVNPLLVFTRSPGTITLASFNGSNGNFPTGSEVLDSSGNLYGTTLYGGAYGQGDVYEISRGSNTINVLASFNYENGAYPNAGVILDSSGDLFGTTSQGGGYGAGTVFEIAQGSNTITTLASFDYFDNGGYPYGGVVLDSNGNLYGTTNYGGDNGEGTVYELANGSGTITTLAAFNGTNGAYPISGVVLDSSGNLFGTTNEGGDYNAGTVYEIASSSNTITTLASFNVSNGANPYAGVTLDSNGNLFGTTYYGGANGVNFGGYGTVYEIASGSGIITPLASFDYYNTGGNPYGGVVLDSSGNLYGTTSQGGSLGAGTVYELANGSGTITNLASFDYSTGYNPEGGLTLDNNGNLYGTTSGGGPNYAGTVYVLPVPIAGQIPTAGEALPSLEVSVEDANGNVITSSTDPITISAGGPGGFAGGTTTVNAVNGVATFSDLVLDTAGGYILTATDPVDGLNATSTNITVNPAAPSQLVIGEIPYTTTAGEVLSPYLQVYVEDQFGNVETGSSVPVTVSVASGPGSFASGTLTVDAVNGVATLSDLVLDTAGTYTLAVSDPTDGLPPATTSSFTVTAATASQLAFTQTPGTTTAGQVLAPLQVSVEDQYGNVVTTSTLSVTISVASGPGGIVSGTTTVNAGNGVAAFSDLVLDTAGSYTLTASTGLYGITSGTSNTFTVIPAAATQLGITQTPGTALLASFNADTGSPVYGLTLDSNGNLFGTTKYGGAYGYGSIYELASGSNTITTLASFNFDNGYYPQGGLTLDSNGNLFGTTYYGGAYGDGTVFELANGSTSITTLASFDYDNGAHPQGDVALDSSGNLFGTAINGGTSNLGTVFELVNGSGTLTALASFTGDNGANPNSGVVVDSNGDVFGTADYNGPNQYGTLFEVPQGSGVITDLVLFNGGGPTGGLALDSAGNLYGTSTGDGAFNQGTIYELANGSTSLTTLASFNGSSDGSFPRGLTLDSAGNLFGTTAGGGADDLGTVYELVKGSGTITTLTSFNSSANGFNPSGGLVVDSSGDLFGTTTQGGASGDGTVFEVRIQTAGQVLDPALQVSVEDQYGNVVTTSSAPVTVSVASGPGNFTSGSTTTMDAVNGVATFSNLVLDTAGNYTLDATDTTDGLKSANTDIAVVPAAASQLVITQTPGTTTVGQALSPSLQVSVEDAYGNVVTTSTKSVTVSVASGPGGFASGGTLTVNAVNGVATFSNLTLDTAGSYTLTAADTPDGLTSATTGSITVEAILSVAATSKATVLQNVSSGLIQLATFGQVGGSANAADYTATVPWGDGGTGSSLGTNPALTITVVGGQVTVSGTHTYTNAGLFYPIVTLTYEGVSVSTNANAIVIDVAADVTSHIKTKATPYYRNPLTKITTSTLTVTNTGNTSLSGEFYLVLQGLTSGVTLQTATITVGGTSYNLTIDATSAGNPMIVIPTNLLSTLARNQSFQVNLGFSNPNNSLIKYNPTLYSDPSATL